MFETVYRDVLQSDWMSCVQRDSGLFSWSRTLSRERSVGARRRACPTHRRRFWRNRGVGTAFPCVPLHFKNCLASFCPSLWVTLYCVYVCAESRTLRTRTSTLTRGRSLSVRPLQLHQPPSHAAKCIRPSLRKSSV